MIPDITRVTDLENELRWAYIKFLENPSKVRKINPKIYAGYLLEDTDSVFPYQVDKQTMAQAHDLKKEVLFIQQRAAYEIVSFASKAYSLINAKEFLVDMEEFYRINGEASRDMLCVENKWIDWTCCWKHRLYIIISRNRRYWHYIYDSSYYVTEQMKRKGKEGAIGSDNWYEELFFLMSKQK